MEMEHITLVALANGRAWRILTPAASFLVYMGPELNKYEVCNSQGEIVARVENLSDVRYAVFNLMAERRA